MSNSLVRMSLALFGYEEDLQKDQKKKRKNKSKGTLDLIPSNHRIITKKNKKETISLGRSSKLNVYEAKKRLDSKCDPTEENIKRLLLLSGKKTNSSQPTKKLVKRALKKSHAFNKKKKAEKTTVFTEEDFKKFEEEYHQL